MISDTTIALLIVLGALALAYVVATALHATRLAASLKDALTAAGALLPVLTAKAAAAAGGTIPLRADTRVWLPTSVLHPQGQLAQVLPQGAERSTWYNDCGETCCAMVIRSARGVQVAPDSLREVALGDASNGLTTADSCVGILALSSIRATRVVPSGNGWLDLLDTATKDGRPVLALGTWPTPGGVLHWLLVTSTDADRVYYINPWGGVSSWLSKGDWASFHSNDYVEITSHLLFP